MDYNNSTNCCSKYVESIRGIIYASEFEMHVPFLCSLPNKSFTEYKVQLNTKTTHNHIKVRDKFFSYVEALRTGKLTNDDFDIHVSRLREYGNVKNVDKGEKYRYTILFCETKKHFWKIIPFSENIIITKYSYVEHLYRVLSTINYEQATLGEVLRSLGLMGLVGDCNIELVNVMKKMLFYYHPDRNKNETSKKIFMLINENFYKPIFIIFDNFEKYSNCAYTSCQLDEFLTWQISEIKERRGETTNLHVSMQEKEMNVLAIYNHFLSKYEPLGDFGYSVLDERFTWQRPVGSYTVEHYRNEKADILKEKDKFLILIRELIKEYIVIAQLTVNLGEIVDDTSDEAQILKKEKQTFINSIVENQKHLTRVEEQIIYLVRHFIPLFDPMIHKYEKEINYLRDVCAGKVNFEEKWKVRYEWDKEQQERCKAKIKKAKLNTFVDERRLISYQEKVQELKREKLEMEYLLSCMSSEIQEVLMEKVKFKNTISSAAKSLIFITSKEIVENECVSILNEYKHIKKLSKIPKTKNEMSILYNQNSIFENKFMTELEKCNLQKNEKLQNKQDLLAMIKKIKNIEEEANEERKAKEDAEEKSKTYEKLLLQIKNGKISIQQLRHIDIESLKANYPE